MCEHGLVLARLYEHLFELDTVFEQNELHLVVVVREREPTEPDHRCLLPSSVFETAASKEGGLRTIIK
jgi:hypothetical protein